MKSADNPGSLPIEAVQVVSLMGYPWEEEDQELRSQMREIIRSNGGSQAAEKTVFWMTKSTSYFCIFQYHLCFSDFARIPREVVVLGCLCLLILNQSLNQSLQSLNLFPQNLIRCPDHLNKSLQNLFWSPRADLVP
jgi:hypothetical protein